MEYDPNIKPDDPIWFLNYPWQIDGKWRLGVFVRWTVDQKMAVVSDGVNAELKGRWHYGHMLNRELNQISLTPPEGYKIYKMGTLTEAYK